MKLALAGDTMLGRKVAERLGHVPPTALFSDEVVAVTHEADLFVLNLECAISERGTPWPDPAKPFFFRAPPVAVDVLHHLGVSCATGSGAPAQTSAPRSTRAAAGSSSSGDRR